MTAITPKAQLIRHCTEAASTTHAECAEILATKDHDGQVTEAQASLAGCGLALVDLLSRQADIVHSLYQNDIIPATTTPSSTGEQKKHVTEKYDLALKRLEDIASIAYAKFYAYLFKDLPVCWRQLYTDARILKFCLLFLKSSYAVHESDGCPPGDVGAITHSHDDLDELVKTLDLALILAGAPGEKRGRGWIDKALELLQLVWLEVGEHRLDDDITSSHGRPAKRAKRAKLMGDPPHSQQTSPSHHP
ncbi:hypothetical protein NUW58_g7524 [Xylaria curta]|uniref:Uncharacterized protein n=1 Tax=Xylaria curta TaxID=42375 RepID=A0ACC1NHL4_9PEZI|nr:hypothetical protein NUW58_g7524 [Xylaria curta]